MTAPLFTDMELKAREILRGARSTDWSPCQQRILNVFMACWENAMTAEKITAIGEALYGPAGLKLQPFITSLVRRKVLRARMSRGERLYEINL